MSLVRRFTCVSRDLGCRSRDEVATVSDKTFIAWPDEYRSCQKRHRDRLGVPLLMAARRLIPSFARSRGLVNQIYFQCATEKFANAMTISVKSLEIPAIPLGKTRT